jgi:hypothetical protein
MASTPQLEPQIFITPRFQKALDAASGWLKHRVYSKIHRFVKLFRANPISAGGEYKVFKSVEPHVVLEIRLNDKYRLLGHWEKQKLTLVDFGNHDDVYSPLTLNLLENQLAAAERASENYWPETSNFGPLFDVQPARHGGTTDGDSDEGWLHFLVEDQLGIATTVVRQVKRASRTHPRRYVIIGAAGSGKTCILARLLFDLVEADQKPGLIVSDAVAEYIKSGGLNVEAFRVPPSSLWDKEWVPQHETLLFDDPATFADIDQACFRAGDPYRAVIVAFNPFKLSDDFSHEEYDALKELLEIRPFVLSDWDYRKKRVGNAAERVIDLISESMPLK